MWALLKPMVGLDPKEANLFRQPLIQSRLEPLLGSHYSGAVQLLETADKIQQEGPLFYVVSKYTPVPELAEKAGFVWNSETNQMAVLMVSGGAPQVFAEKLNNEVVEQIPVWPKELSDYTEPAKLQQQAINKAKQQLSDNIPVPAAVVPLVDNAKNLKDIKGQTKNLLEEKKQSLVDHALSPLIDAKQQAQQQMQQVKEQSTQAVLTPINDVKQQAQQQVQQVKEQSTQAVLTPITDAKQQAQQQVQQVKEQSTQAVLTPITDAKQQAQQQVQQVKEQSTQAVLTPITDVKQQAQQQMQQVKEQSAEADLVAEDDLAAELATEQQSLKSEKSQRVNLLQQQIKAAEQQLQQASTTDDRKKIELQLQQLKTMLNLLKATD
ncbi:PspA/IM30 family protein [Rheinheimera tilapiae]|uniref:PspA/IM30 family protein n=1 Tax=Rheinheimera tilapiae TaxID=875043 RepID=A0ABV6BC46_9GAMM